MQIPKEPEEIGSVQSRWRLPARWIARLQQLGGGETVLVWAGISIVAVGFGLLGFSWSKVASILDVGRQMPYLISGGLTSIGLILVGLAFVQIGAARRDAVEQMSRLDRLRETLQNLRLLIESENSAPSNDSNKDTLEI